MTVPASLFTFNPIGTAIGLITWALGRERASIDDIAKGANPRFSAPAKELIRQREERQARKNPVTDAPAPGEAPQVDLPPTSSAPPEESFAPPVPVILPPVEYTPPPRALPPTAPPFGSGAVRVITTIGEALSRVSVPIFGVIFPAPGGAYDEYTDIPLDYRMPPNKPPPRWDVPLDPILPPNWQDIAYEPNPNFKPTRRIDTAPIGDPVPTAAPTERPGRGIEFDPGVYVPPAIDLPMPEFDVETPTNPGTRLFTPFDLLPFAPVDPRATPFRNPRTQPKPAPVGNPFFQPIGDPLATPWASPAPAPAVPGLPRPGQPYLDPLPGLGDAPGFDALPQFRAAPASPGDCVCTETKPKKRAPPKDRTVCYSGTFREYSRGQSKVRRKEVPCESKKATAKRLLDSVSTPGRSILSTIPTFF